MENKLFIVNWSPLPINDMPALRLLRLYESGEGIVLVTSLTHARKPPNYETVLSAVTLSGVKTSLLPFAIAQLLSPPPNWDIQRVGDGGAHVVVERAGGALNSLHLLKWQGTGGVLSERHPHDSFHNPRFIKHGRGAAKEAVSALVNTRHLVVFAPQAGRFGAYTPVCDADDAIILQDAGGFALFYKESIPGPVRGRDIPPGVLYQRRLGPDFRPVSAPVKPLGDTTIFEFDVDESGHNITLFATTKAGFILAQGAPLAQGGAFSAFSETAHPSILTRPCLVAQARILRLAVLEAEQTPQARALISTVAAP